MNTKYVITLVVASMNVSHASKAFWLKVSTLYCGNRGCVSPLVGSVTANYVLKLAGSYFSTPFHFSFEGRFLAASVIIW